MKQDKYFLLTIGYILTAVLVFSLVIVSVASEKLNSSKLITTEKIVYNAVPYSEIDYKVLDTFIGTMTGYGPDCAGCSGLVYCKPYQNVKNGNIYYEDDEYGKIRIVAADKKFPCGTIVRVTVSKLYEEPIIAVVLDRGGKIKGNKFDLLYDDETSTSPVGFQRNVQYEVLRFGW